MQRAKQKKTNSELFRYPPHSDIVCGAVSCIEANRKLKDVDEALLTAQAVGNIVAFLQHSSAGDRDTLLSTDTMFEVLRGQEQILEITRIMARRVEQYLTLDALGEVKS